MLTTGSASSRASKVEAPVELRFVDMLLIIIATLMFVAVLLTLASAFASGRLNLALRIITRSAPAAMTGQPYQLQLAAQGGDGSYSWLTATGSLPPGLFLLSDGTIAGTPARAGSATVTIEVTDGQQHSASQQLNFDVRPSGTRAAHAVPPHMVSHAVLLPVAVNGRPYQYGLAAQGGIPPYQWALARGKLPPGLYLTSQGGLTGRPQAPGTTTFTVRVADSTGNAAAQQVTLTVQAAPPAFWQTVLHWIKIIFIDISITLTILIIIMSVWTYFFGAPPTPEIPSRRMRRLLSGSGRR
jgi:hypothetical protein